MNRVEIYAKSWCPYCHGAKNLLNEKGVDFVEYDVTEDAAKESEMRQRSGRTTVPQVFIDDEHVGGFDDLMALEQSGVLDQQLGLAEHAA